MRRMTRVAPISAHWILVGVFCVTAGCASSADKTPDPSEAVGATSAALSDAQLGEQLFDTQTFRGNGRTCSTCHTDANNGTLSPQQVQNLAQNHPADPIFQPIDSDDGVGHSYTRLKTSATIRIHMPLPSNIRLLDDPSATEVVINRGIPTVQNTPALNPFLMSDGREPDLISQARDAINAHLQPRIQPTATQLNLIATYEKTLFSSPALQDFYNGGKLSLPTAHTDSEIRGKKFFTDGNGFCGFCHNNNLGDRSKKGFELQFVLAGELDGDTVINDMRMYVVGNLDGSPCDPTACANLALPAGGGQCVTTPINGCTQPFRDPGAMLVSGDIHDGGLLKIPILWGLNGTAPYFHDNSAADLHQVMAHYHRLIDNHMDPNAFGASLNTNISPQDDEDIIAFLKLF